jgi:hypothetical protein
MSIYESRCIHEGLGIQEDKFMCKGIHYKKFTYSNQSVQWNQSARLNHLSG